MDKCYICGKSLKQPTSIFPTTVYITSGAFHNADIRVDFKLCYECSEWGIRVPDALDAIVVSRNK